MAVRRPIILDGFPYVHDNHRKGAAALLAGTGGNTGNLAFRYAIASHIVGPVFLNWGTPPREIRAAGDIVVLPLANQLGSHTDLSSQADHLAEVGLPVVALGLGAQADAIGDDITLTPGTLRWLKEITARAPSEHPNIGARGEYTAAQIAKLGWPDAASVIGCPSNFINLEDDIAASVARGFKRTPTRIAVTAGIPYIAKLAGLESRLAEIVTLTDGAYIVQHDIEMIMLARGEFGALGENLLKVCKDYIRPGSTDDEFKLWLRQYAYAFFDVAGWMAFLRRFDFVVGTRFHGVMLAIQAGIPAGCIAHDSRTLEMCQTMGIPVCYYDVAAEKISRDNVLDYFQFEQGKYRETRRNLFRNYTAVLQAAGVQKSGNLARLV
jgi:hypothetical protein